MFSILNTLVVAAQSRRQYGQGMVEYGLILALVSVVALTALGGIGTEVNTAFQAVSTALAG